MGLSASTVTPSPGEGQLTWRRGQGKCVKARREGLAPRPSAGVGEQVRHPRGGATSPRGEMEAQVPTDTQMVGAAGSSSTSLPRLPTVS